MPTKPVLFIPGFPGSHLFDETRNRGIFPAVGSLLSATAKATILPRLRGPAGPNDDDGVVAGDPIRHAIQLLGFIDLGKQADSLYDILAKIGYKVGEPLLEPFGWDWRKPLDADRTQEELESAIVRLHERHGPVVAIAHSTGGLVLRHRLESKPELADRLERIIAFGVPWAGLLKPLETLIGDRGFGPVTAAEAQDVLAHSWSTFDILPPDPAKSDLRDAAGNALDLVLDADGRAAGPLVDRSWFSPALRDVMEARAERADQRFGRRTSSLRLGGRQLPVTNVVGWGGGTLGRARIGSGQPFEPLRPTFDDSTFDDGDETVPRRSAAWLRGPGVTTMHVPVGHYPRRTKHTTLWSTEGGRELLREILGGQDRPPFAYAAVDSRDHGSGSAQVRVRLVALDDRGQSLPQARARVVGVTDEEPFDPDRAGLHLIRVPRARMTSVGNTLRRFEVEIRWGSGTPSERRRRPLTVVR